MPVRLYSAQDGGVEAPTFAPDEVYPLRWEIDIDSVFLNGQRIEDSTIPPKGVNPGRVTALIDTGNSVIRGPQDMVDNILQTVSPGYDPDTASENSPPIPCDMPHSLSFQIGGKMFPVDPRDFISISEDDTTCTAGNLLVTDPPSSGTLFRWSLGDPFMKSNLVAFYYGNLTHPSVDPPRIGFLSTVPGNADDLLGQAVQDAKNNGGILERTIVPAPTASAANQPLVTLTAVSIIRPSSTATVSSKGKENTASTSAQPLRIINSCALLMLLWTLSWLC
ncbi:hypothetical protein C0995_010290 [Termitomyces sp. Mi166|nr:hypothetical protein C0995_010290 [Termitomyces sp. Mi166\